MFEAQVAMNFCSKKKSSEKKRSWKDELDESAETSAKTSKQDAARIEQFRKELAEKERVEALNKKKMDSQAAATARVEGRSSDVGTMCWFNISIKPIPYKSTACPTNHPICRPLHERSMSSKD